MISGAQECPNLSFGHKHLTKLTTLFHSPRRLAAFSQRQHMLSQSYSVEAVSNYGDELQIFLSYYCSSVEIMTQLPSVKCQADQSEIQARFLQKGPNDKTCYEPSISSPVPLLWEHLGQVESETNHKSCHLNKVINMCLARISHIYIFYLTLLVLLILYFSSQCYL